MARRLAAENRAETERCFFPSQCSKKLTKVSGRFLTIDHPRDAELIDENAKAGGPEGFLQRNPHSAALCQ